MAAPTGVWVSYDAMEKPAIFSSENGALRHAVKTKGDVVFWPFGMTLNEAIAAAAAKEVKGNE